MTEKFHTASPGSALVKQGSSFLIDLVRPLRIGRAYLRYRELRATGLTAALRTAWAKRTILPLIFEAKPIVSEGSVEVHMLLNHPRVVEAAWALYSFVFFLSVPCRLVVHDDGSLTESDAQRLRQLFPGLQIIFRKEADGLVLDELERRGLYNCARLRRSLVFALKLFDPLFFGSSEYFFMLDSDILFYRSFSIINKYLSLKTPFFGKDVAHSLSLSPAEFNEVTGGSLPALFNAGFIGVPRNIVELSLIDRWLSYPSFWEPESGKGEFYADQTIWAGLLCRNRAAVLGDSFVVSPREPVSGGAIGTHFCGFGLPRSLFYWSGVPCAARALARAGALPVTKLQV